MVAAGHVVCQVQGRKPLMDTELIATLVGLALVDSVNLSTIWVVLAILLLARRPAATSWTFAAGAFISFITATLAFYFVASAAASVLFGLTHWLRDRKSTRLNSSHVAISYAVFCLNKK